MPAGLPLPAVIRPESLKRFDLSTYLVPDGLHPLLSRRRANESPSVGAGHDRVPAETERDRTAKLPKNMPASMAARPRLPEP